MENIEKSLLGFINSPKDAKAKVAIIKGAWGAGKTYFWNKFIKSNIKNLSVEYLSHVSLFGLNSVEEITEQIYKNSQKSGTKSKNGNFYAWIQKCLKKTKFLTVADAPYVNMTLVRNLIIEHGIKKFLICFDDLERISDQLSLHTVLGYINRLKEERECKIVIICNEDELLKNVKEDGATSPNKIIMDKYREKVVDLDLYYKPTIRENLQIIWGDSIPSTIESLFTNLDKNNIRIMHQVKVAVDYFRDASQRLQLAKQCSDAFMQHVAILCIFRHAYASIMSLEKISQATLGYLYLKEEDRDEAEKEKIELFEKSNYIYSDEDALIIDYLTNGWVSENQIKDTFDSLNKQERSKALADQLNALIWKVQYLFGAVPETALQDAEKFFVDNYEMLKFSDAVYLNEFLKKHTRFNHDSEIEKLMDTLVPTLTGRQRFEDFWMQGLPTETREKIQARLDAVDRSRPIQEVILAIGGGQDGWNSEDLLGLKNYTVEDYQSWISLITDMDIIRALREFLRRVNSETHYGGDKIVEKIRLALESISKRGDIDRMRVENLLAKR